MFYLSGAYKDKLVGVKDTKDNVEEFYEVDFLLNLGIDIYGLNIEIEEGFSDEYFDYIPYLGGWKVECHRVNDKHLRPVLHALVAGRKVLSADYAFSKCAVMETLDLSLFKPIWITILRGLCSGCVNLKSVTFGSLQSKLLTNMNYLFSGCKKLTTVDFGNLDTSNVNSFRGGFAGCESLTTVNLHCLNTSRMWDIASLFYNCRSLEIIDFSCSCFERLGNMTELCYNCTSLREIHFGGLTLSDDIRYPSVFYNCSSLRFINLERFDAFNIYANTLHNFLAEIPQPNVFVCNMPVENLVENTTIVTLGYNTITRIGKLNSPILMYGGNRGAVLKRGGRSFTDLIKLVLAKKQILGDNSGLVVYRVED